ncbi:MAG: hypothetical protein Q7T41_01005, partial [Candidatus Saccharibacteria bacterium]|nr:hypothetical protein [Candidatus Saccharibacteria bacterium]
MSNYLKLGLTVMLGCIMALVVSLSCDKAQAAGEATNKLPVDDTYLVISNASATGGSFSSPSSTNFLYVKDGTSASVKISTPSLGSIDYFIVSYLDNAGSCNDFNPKKELTKWLAVDTKDSISVDTTSAEGKLAKTIKSSTDTYRIYCVTVFTISTAEISFKLSSDAGSYLGVYAGTNTSTGTGFFARSGAYWNEVIAFATPCNSGSQSAISNDILLYDLDNGYSQSPNVNVSLTRFDRVTGAYISATPLRTSPKQPSAPSYDLTYNFSGFGAMVYSTDGSWVPPYDNNYTWRVSPEDDTWHSDSKYQLVVSGMGASNKIRIRIPYDQINSAIVCPPP